MTNKPSPNETQWIAVDWGTSSFRAWRMQAGIALEQISTADGLLSLRASEQTYDHAALRLLSPWLSSNEQPATTVLMSGMVGSRQGWKEAPYVAAPACLSALCENLIEAPTASQLARFYIVPGVSQASPQDVMRGEETQLLGAAAQPSWPNHHTLVVMPGTHSKHVLFHAGSQTIQGFSTYLTGEMFSLLKQHSLLAASMLGNTFDASSFCEAVQIGAQKDARSGRLLNELFATRARGLLGHLPAQHTESWLSGLLIGHELGGTPAALPVALIGEPALCERYHLAMQTLNYPSVHIAEPASAAQGLWQIYQQWTK
jgi:2-dehydro-3-deoxygalactonokinase